MVKDSSIPIWNNAQHTERERSAVSLFVVRLLGYLLLCIFHSQHGNRQKPTITYHIDQLPVEVESLCAGCECPNKFVEEHGTVSSCFWLPLAEHIRASSPTSPTESNGRCREREFSENLDSTFSLYVVLSCS